MAERYAKKHSSYLFTSLSFTERSKKGRMARVCFDWRASLSAQHRHYEIEFAEMLTDFLGDYSGDVTPVPIPNTVVKLSSADDTGNSRESRSLPGLCPPQLKNCGGIFFAFFVTRSGISTPLR